MMTRTNLSSPDKPAELIVFPFTKRVGRIRETARKLHDKPSEAAAAYYRRQVTASIEGQLDRIGLNLVEQARHLDTFWAAVDRELALCLEDAG